MWQPASPTSAQPGPYGRAEEVRELRRAVEALLAPCPRARARPARARRRRRQELSLDVGAHDCSSSIGHATKTAKSPSLVGNAKITRPVAQVELEPIAGTPLQYEKYQQDSVGTAS